MRVFFNLNFQYIHLGINIAKFSENFCYQFSLFQLHQTSL